jgi:hypothetical protein
MPKVINVFNCWDEEVAMDAGQLTELGGKYGIRSLMVATQCLKDGRIGWIDYKSHSQKEFANQ